MLDSVHEFLIAKTRLRAPPRLKLIAARQGTNENYPCQNPADFWSNYDAGKK